MVMALDWGHFDTGFFLKDFSKRTGWPIGYEEIRILKKRSLVPDLVIYYSKNAQRNWIECLNWGHVNKSTDFKNVCK